MIKLFHRITLFFNAFLFMNLLFLCKEIILYLTNVSMQKCSVLVGIILLVIFNILGLIGCFFIYSKPNVDKVKGKILKKSNITASYYFGYFSLFVLLFMSFSFDNWLNIFIFLVLTVALAVVYCRNELFYINPTLFLLGIRVYELEVQFGERKECFSVLTKDKLTVGLECNFYSTDHEITRCEK